MLPKSHSKENSGENGPGNGSRKPFWHLSGDINVAVVIALVGNMLLGTWFLAMAYSRLDQVEQWRRSVEPQGERLIRLEEKIGVLQQGVTKIESRLEQLIRPQH